MNEWQNTGFAHNNILPSSQIHFQILANAELQLHMEIKVTFFEHKI